MLELQVTEDDDLFNTDEPTGVKDSRIVVEKSPEHEGMLTASKKEKSKKDKKSEKKKVEEQTSSDSDGCEKIKDHERSVKSKYVIKYVQHVCQ